MFSAAEPDLQDGLNFSVGYTGLPRCTESRKERRNERMRPDLTSGALGCGGSRSCRACAMFRQIHLLPRCTSRWVAARAARPDPALHFRGQLCGRGRRLEPRLRGCLPGIAAAGDPTVQIPPLLDRVMSLPFAKSLLRENTYGGFCESWMTRLRELDAG